MTSFLGIKMMQNWNELSLWEEFFNQNPLRTFIEVGTGAGGMATYLALQCRHRGITFHTFDHQTWLDFHTDLARFLDLPNSFHHCDIFSVGSTELADLLWNSPKPMAVFFDNGNKPLEWKTFAALTEPGDFCIVHDWGKEFRTRDIGLVPVKRMTITEDRRFAKLKTAWFKRLADE